MSSEENQDVEGEGGWDVLDGPNASQEAVASSGENIDEGSMSAVHSQIREQERQETATGLDTQNQPPTNRSRNDGTTDASEINWPALFDEVGFDSETPKSQTQLCLAVEVSDQTPRIDGGLDKSEIALEIISDAVELGVLHSFKPTTAHGLPSPSKYRLRGDGR